MAERNLGLDIALGGDLFSSVLQEEVKPVPEELGFGDYIADIVRAPVGGLSDAVQGRSGF